MSSLSPIAIRDDNVPALEGQTFFDGLRALGLSHFELRVTPDNTLPSLAAESGWNVFDEAGVAALKTRLKNENARVVALCLATDFSSPNAATHADWVIYLTHVARELNVPAIRLDPLTANRDLPAAAIRDNLVRHVGRILEKTENVHFGLENHGVVGNDPHFLDEVFAALDDARLGMTLDTANFYWSGMPLNEVYTTLEHFAPRAKHTHIKSIAYPSELRETRREAGFGYAEFAAPIDEGDLDLRRVVKLLHKANYPGSFCIENETLSRFSPAERVEVLRREVAALQTVMAS